MFSVVEGAGAAQGIEDVCCDPQRFAPGPPVQSLHLGYGGPAIWLKLQPAASGGVLQFEPILDRVRLYFRSRRDGRWHSSQTGDLLPNADKPFVTPFMALPLSGERAEDVDGDAVYALVEQRAALSLSVKQWRDLDFTVMQEHDRTIKSFLLGAVCAIALYNLVVSLLVRDAAFAFNGLSILSICVCALYLSGYGAAYLWSGIAWASNWIFILANVSCLVFAGCFMALFLKTADRPRTSEWPVLVAPALALVVLVGGLLAHAPYWVVLPAVLALAAAFLLVALAVSARRAFGGDARARVLLLPLAGAIIPGTLLSALDKFAGFQLPGVGNNTLEITLVVEALLFSLALARRVRLAEDAARDNAAALLEARSRGSAQILMAQDRERRRLAAELHDNLGQELTLAAAAARRLFGSAGDGPAGLRGDPSDSLSGDPRDDLSGRIATALQKLRHISHEMHPAMVEHLGLAAAIEDAAQRAAQASGIEFGCSIDIVEADVEPGARLHLLRIVQECLSNIVRHSGATVCSLALTQAGRQMALEIEDNGRGLPPEAGPSGLGMTSIDERVRALGGTWLTDSSPDGGARMRVVAPLKPAGATTGKPTP